MCNILVTMSIYILFCKYISLVVEKNQTDTTSLQRQASKPNQRIKIAAQFLLLGESQANG